VQNHQKASTCAFIERDLQFAPKISEIINMEEQISQEHFNLFYANFAALIDSMNTLKKRR